MNEPRISVIIPVWNHAKEVIVCLDALEKQTFRSFEVVTVNDGSTDDLEERLRGKTFSFPFQFISRKENRGPCATRNEGFRASHAPFVIFLDADIVLEPTALQKMMNALDAHPEVAFAYPSHYFGWKLYKGRPFDEVALQQCNYIHTSALIRREAFPGFDESLKRFQDWDLWLTIARHGGKGIWIPEALFHVATGGTMSKWMPSFLFRVPWDLFGWMPEEIKKYRAAEEVIRKKHGLSSATCEPSASRQVRGWILGIILFEVLSFCVTFFPRINSVVALVLALFLFVLACARPTTALAILAVEYFIGSKGALLNFGGNAVNNGGVSIRILFFIAFLFGWGVWAFRHKTWKAWRSYLSGRWIYLALVAILIYAFVLGYMRGNRPFLFQDANAWGMWLLLVPALDLAQHEGERLKKIIVPAVIAALFWLPIKTLVLFYLFSHGFPAWFLDPIYLWVRRSGVGEIAHIIGGASRIFFQSHIYVLFVILALWIKRVYGNSWKKWEVTLLVLSLAEIIISLSRSFWIGLFVGSVSLFVFLLIRKRDAWWIFVSRAFFSSIAAFALVAILFFSPPFPKNGASFSNMIRSRTDLSEGAAVSRWNLLPVVWNKIKDAPLLGSGFGTTVTYQSQDPRMVQKTGGVYTTYAFEWGWLEHWIKFGILGIPLILALLIFLGLRLWRTRASLWMRLAGVITLVTLGAVHVFTPYLNHPLGFVVLMALEGVLVIFNSPPYQGGDAEGVSPSEERLLPLPLLAEEGK